MIKVNEGCSVYRVIKVNKGCSVYRVIKVNEGCSVYRVIKVNEGCSVYRGNKVIDEVSFHQVTQCLPSHQWLPSSKLLSVISKDRASTLTKCMMMPSTIVDAEYQKVTE